MEPGAMIAWMCIFFKEEEKKPDNPAWNSFDTYLTAITKPSDKTTQHLPLVPQPSLFKPYSLGHDRSDHDDWNGDPLY
jgi:hypothetical protein